MRHRIVPPPPHLRHHVRFFWTLDDAERGVPPRLLKVFACRYPRLVFHSADGRPAVHLASDALPTLFLSGIHAIPRTLAFRGPFTLTGVSFYPTVIRSLFGVEAHELSDGFPDLSHLALSHVASSSLHDRLLGAPTQEARIGVLVAFITTLLASAGARDPDVVRAFDHLRTHRHDGDASVWQLAKQLRLSERSLERRFRTAVGFTPTALLGEGKEHAESSSMFVGTA